MLQPQSIGGNCFQCCDNPNHIVCSNPNHIVCSNNASVGFVLARIRSVSENEWKEALSSDFRNVKEWIPISSKLEAYRIREVKPESPEAYKFWGKLKL